MYSNDSNCRKCLAIYNKNMSTISGDQTQFLNDGTKINYCTSGNGNHPVLLLPGALGTGRSDFTPQLEGVNHKEKMLK